MVVESFVTITGMEKPPVPVTLPLDKTEPEQLEVPYTRTKALASAVPTSVGKLLLDGEVGVTDVNTGALGAVLSSTYDTNVVEHADTLPVASVACA